MKRLTAPLILQVYLPSGLFVVVSWISFIIPPEVKPGMTDKRVIFYHLHKIPYLQVQGVYIDNFQLTMVSKTVKIFKWFNKLHLLLGRLALLITLFLVLVNIFNSAKDNSPKSESLTAVETWIIICIFHVFTVLLEYAFVLKIIQNEKRNGNSLKAKCKNCWNSQALSKYFVRKGNVKVEMGKIQSFPNDTSVIRGSNEPLNDAMTQTDVEEGQSSQKNIKNHERLDKIAIFVFPTLFALSNLLYWSFYLG